MQMSASKNFPKREELGSSFVAISRDVILAITDA